MLSQMFDIIMVWKVLRYINNNNGDESFDFIFHFARY